jgi:hypothetical protein
MRAAVSAVRIHVSAGIQSNAENARQRSNSWLNDAGLANGVERKIDDLR